MFIFGVYHFKFCKFHSFLVKSYICTYMYCIYVFSVALYSFFGDSFSTCFAYAIHNREETSSRSKKKKKKHKSGTFICTICGQLTCLCCQLSWSMWTRTWRFFALSVNIGFIYLWCSALRDMFEKVEIYRVCRKRWIKRKKVIFVDIKNLIRMVPYCFCDKSVFHNQLFLLEIFLFPSIFLKCHLFDIWNLTNSWQLFLKIPVLEY